ncbi:MAG: AzlC family ABC transporter permease [Clostridia bacterium]
MPGYTKGVRDGVAIGLGYLSVAFSFGINAVSGGLSVLQAVLISLANVTSAGQMAGLEQMIKLAPLFEVALVQLTINLRYALMSISLSQKLDDSVGTIHRMAIAFVNTDEVFAVASAQAGLLGKNYLYGLITAPYLGWALGTLLGAAAGSLLPGSVSNALGIMIYAMFVAIVIPPTKHDKAIRFVVLAAGVLSVALYYLPGLRTLSGGAMIIVCSVAAAALGAWRYPVREEDA